MTAGHGRPARGRAPQSTAKRAPKHVRTKSRLWAGAAAGLAVGGLVVGAVANAATGTTPTAVRKASPASTAPPASAALQADFTAAAAEFQVPVSVLLAVSYQETLWESHQGEPSVTGNYNVMGLTSVNPADLNPVTTAEKKADLAGAAGDPAQIAKKSTASAAAASAAAAQQLAQFETVDTTAPALHTLDAAAALIKQPDSTLRGQMKQSVRGGAALLASYEKAAKGSLPTDAGQWYPAVAQFSQAADTATQNQFADGVYGVIATGAARTTGDNQAVLLAAEPAVKPQPQTAPGRARGLTAAQTCEAGPAGCTFVPAAAGNFDVANRLNAADGDTVRDIVIHTTEGSAASAINTFRTYNPSNPTSAHFVVAATGAVTQLVHTKDVAFQADNKTINSHSIGVEDEGYALKTGSWVSEVEYDASAALVKQLAKLYSIPLDREHILGHDDVPYVTGDYVTDQQDDPGPYWDWSHYLSLLGAPALDGTGMPLVGGTVTIAPDYASNKPVLTGCSGGACVSHPANFVYLRTSPSSSAPLISDALLKSVRTTSATTGGADVSDKAVYGQSFVVAGVSGDWTAIWYGGQEAWFDNPGGVNTYANGNPAQNLVLPKGSTPIKVYGRAYPEAAAYTTAGVPADVQPLVALPHYSIAPGQAYTTTGRRAGR
ncbi:N-acetylmuramoyl-L-alanine amidase [Streptacidiphilus sp. PAMC 29251]